MIISWILLTLLLCRAYEDRIKAIVYSGIIYTSFIYISTELLSLINGIYTWSLWALWSLAILGLGIAGVKLHVFQELRIFITFIKNQSKWFVACITLFSVIMCLLALKVCPYNFDSMIYHLPRLFFWYENHSANYYATGMFNQLASPILGAYTNLHVYTLLGGSDRFQNLVQCLAYLHSGFLVYALAKKLGCSKAWCTFSLILFWSTRIIFMESTTTQVDIFSTIWVLTFVYLLQDFCHPNVKLEVTSSNLLEIILLAITVALGYMSKPYTGIAMLVFVVGLITVCIVRKDNIKVIFYYIIRIAPIIVVMIIPQFIRNILAFGSIGVDEVGKAQLVGTLNPKYVFINALKNYTYNLPVNWLIATEGWIYKFCMTAANILHVDIADATISETPGEYNKYNSAWITCDQTANPVIGWLFTICLIAGIVYLCVRISKKTLKLSEQLIFCICTSASFLIFCCVLRYEEYVSRYMISFFALICPMIALCIEKFIKKPDNQKCFRAIIYFWCVLEAILLIDAIRPYATASRNSGYYSFNLDSYGEYLDLCNDLTGLDGDKLGIITKGYGFQYPYYQTLKNDWNEIKNVNVENGSNKYEDMTFVPDVILSFANMSDLDISCHDNTYILVNTYDSGISLYALAK